MRRSDRQEAKSAAEWDVLTKWRNVMAYLMKPGVKREIRRGLSRRRRHEARITARMGAINPE